jgi:hypothetical protein
VTSAGFDRPDAPGRDPDAPQFDMEHNLGQLLVLRVIGQQQTETEYGVRPVVVADVFVIGPENGGVIRAEYPESWLFGTVLHSQLRGKIGRTVVGLLEQGEKRPGRKPPWRLNGEARSRRSSSRSSPRGVRRRQPASRVVRPRGRRSSSPRTRTRGRRSSRRSSRVRGVSSRCPRPPRPVRRHRLRGDRRSPRLLPRHRGSSPRPPRVALPRSDRNLTRNRVAVRQDLPPGSGNGTITVRA